MARNTLIVGIGGVSVALLVAAIAGTYRAFSYLAALLVLGTIASAAIERTGRERSLTPYTGLLAGLAALFFAGLTGIWLTWAPGASEYTYVLGLPVPTLVYLLFIWALPLLGAIHYSLIFERIGGDEIVAEIIENARETQATEEVPLRPERVERPEASDD